ncbi:MAG: hypothetical protein JOZ69_10850, partial [Myxococcales bacterium]|nr:hypothetical protein [Myxococcales bacterium]
PGAACDPARAGDYRALGYRKTGASDDADGGPESGEAGVGLLAIRVDADGGIVGADETGAVVLEGALAPAASSPDLTAPGRLDPARTTGLFTYRASASTGGVVFVVFVDRGLLFTSFAPRDADGGAPVYDYAYGAALAQ